MKLCTPAIVYLVLATIALLFNMMNFSIFSTLIHIIFIGLWTLILNWICKKGFTWVSWLLVVLPYLFMGLVVLIAAEYIALNELNAKGYLPTMSP